MNQNKHFRGYFSKLLNKRKKIVKSLSIQKAQKMHTFTYGLFWNKNDIFVYIVFFIQKIFDKTDLYQS